MSRLYYDYLIAFDGAEEEIKKIAETEEERHELWQIIDEIINSRILEILLDRLPEEHHDEFLERLCRAPYDERLILFLNHRIDGNIENIIKKEINNLADEILQDIRGK